MSDTGTNRIVTFYSYKGGTGRTMALANVAWILAGQGLRVLVVDWDLESPGVHRYFHPFLRDKMLRSSPGVIDMVRSFAKRSIQRGTRRPPIADLARVEPYVVRLRWTFPHDGHIDLLPAGRQDQSYSGMVSTFEWPAFYERLGGKLFLEALRDDMRANYDYVLIDSRTGLSDTSGICTVLLPDTVLDCFTLATQSIEGAASVARSIRDQSSDVVIRPVPMRTELVEKAKLEFGRDLARKSFTDFLGDLTDSEVLDYWGSVEIPYQPYYAYEEILAPFGDRPHVNGSMLAAFERLARMITGNPGIEASVMPEMVRRQWLAEFERSAASSDEDVHILYASADRLWAEWVMEELASASVRAILHPIDVLRSENDVEDLRESLAYVAKVVVVLSGLFLAAAHGAVLWSSVTDHEFTPYLIPLRVDALTAGTPAPGAPRVDPLSTDPRRASAMLRRVLGLSALSDADTWEPHSVLKRHSPLSNLPPRGTFVGRAAELEALRARLTGDEPVRQAIFGLAGIGKTQLTLEYARRFHADYDVIWTINGADTGRIEQGLSNLAGEMSSTISSELGIVIDDDDADADAARKILRLVESTTTRRRWLLIYHDIEDPSGEVLALIPRASDTVHVLLTPREAQWGKDAVTQELERFHRDESLELLRRRLPSARTEDANLVAERVGDLPIAVELAANYLATSAMPIPLYLESLDNEQELLRILGPAGESDSISTTWLFTFRQLRRESPAAAWLLELCAILAPDPIPVDMLVGDQLRELLKQQDQITRSPIAQGFLTSDLGRFGLAQVHPTSNTVQLHPLVRLVIRDQIVDPDAMRRAAQDILAGAKPKDPDRQPNWPLYNALWPHAREVAITQAETQDARELTADLARYLYRRGDYRSSSVLCETALTHWKRYDPDDELVLRVRFHLANALRARAELQRAFHIDEDVYERQSRVLGVSSRQTLTTARSLAYDYRAQGRYADAERLDRQTMEGFKAIDPSSDEVLIAENNLAVSLRLLGRFGEAAEHAAHVFEQRTSRLGDHNTSTLTAASNYGRDLRDLGELWAARRILQQTHRDQEEAIGPNHPESLRTARHLTVTLRQLGRFVEAHDLISQTVRRYHDSDHATHPDALACELTQCTTLSAIGSNDEALFNTRKLLPRYESLMGETHVFTQACRSSLSVFMLKADDPGKALAFASQVHEGLLVAFGDEHPHVQLARLNLANVHFANGEFSTALELDTRAYTSLTLQFGVDHPDVLAAQVNLSLSRDQTGAADAARDLFRDALAKSIQLFGGDNPRVSQARDRERTNVYIEPTSL